MNVLTTEQMSWITHLTCDILSSCDGSILKTLEIDGFPYPLSNDLGENLLLSALCAAKSITNLTRFSFKGNSDMFANDNTTNINLLDRVLARQESLQSLSMA